MATFIPQPDMPQIVCSGNHVLIALPPGGQAVYLPPFCVKCGQPVQDEPLVKTFSWHSPMIYLFIFLGVLVYVIVALIVRKSVRVGVPLCAYHKQRRRLWTTLAWVLPLAGIADAFILPEVIGLDGGWTALISVLLVLAGLVIWAVPGNPIRPKSIDSFSAEFSGFSDQFLDRIPILRRS